MLYQGFQAHNDIMFPMRGAAQLMHGMLNSPWFGLNALPLTRQLSAALEVFHVARMTHKRRPFGIDSVIVDGEPRVVTEQVAHALPFASLLHFVKEGVTGQPKLLIVAPMSGHFATLLRDTVRTALQDHDVYITDWVNARDVPLSEGRFGLDEYIEHVIHCLEHMGPHSHVLAICQPCVPTLAAVAVMSEDNNPATPHSMSLMAGPIDCRLQPTAVNELATSKPIEWFESKLIGTVPLRFAGSMRRVYPGFLQLTAFVSMNTQRHIDSLRDMFKHRAAGEDEQAQSIRDFYEEYFAVADLPAEFYIETVKRVFQEYELAKGTFHYRGRLVRPELIRRTTLLTVEGERDDICSIGQTMAAHDLCSGLKPYMKTHYVQPGAGHYGVFSGKRWQRQIYPLMRDTVHYAS